MSNNQKGFSSLLVIIALVALVGVFLLYVLNMVANTEVPLFTEDSNSAVVEDSTATFEELEEDETTPIEIDNTTVNELDVIVNDIDDDSAVETGLEF